MAPRLEVGPTGQSVARRIRKIRLQRNMTQDQLAERLERLGCPIARSGLNFKERGKRAITADELAAIAEALQVPVADLFIESKCTTCEGAPPVGFTCQECGAEGPPRT